MRSRIPAAFAALTVAACGAERPSAAEAIVADSAGVRIVTNTAERNEHVPVWRLSDAPVLDVGTAEGAAEYMLHNVTDVVRLPDEGIVLATAGTMELRRYDGAGRFVRSYGRRGSGPGEFRGPTRVVVTGDSIMVWDEVLRRSAVFTMDGRFVRQQVLGRPASNPRLEAVFEDASFLVADDRFAIPISGFADMTFTLVRYAPDGTLADSAGTHHLTRMGNLGEIGGIGPPVFTPRGVRAGWKRGYWIGTGQDYEIRAYAPTGELRQIIRWAGPPRAVDPALVATYWDQRMRNATGQQRERVELLRAVTPVADRLPPYDAVRASVDGELWVQAFRRPDETGPTRWWVFDTEGVLVARAQLPARFRVTQIAGEYVAGVERDELDVQHARVYALVRM